MNPSMLQVKCICDYMPLNEPNLGIFKSITSFILNDILARFFVSQVMSLFSAWLQSFRNSNDKKNR